MRDRDERSWTDDGEMDRLRELWANPKNSTAAIGRAMRRSKNSVVAKAARMGLTPRPSPIRRRSLDDPPPHRIRRAAALPAITLPPLSSDSAPVPAMPAPLADGPYTAAEIERIRTMWADPANTTRDIAAALNRGRNSVIGRIHRMKLPKRASPIGFGRCPIGFGRPRPKMVTPAAPPAAPAATVTGAAKPPQTRAAEPPALKPAPIAATPEPITLQALPDPVPSRPVPELRRASSKVCAWPIGEPRSKAFRYCDEPARAGKPYCADHCGRAFVTVRDRRLDQHA